MVYQVAGSMSGWMAGSVLLPPGAIKDAEGVGKYLQVITSYESELSRDMCVVVCRLPHATTFSLL